MSARKVQIVIREKDKGSVTEDTDVKYAYLVTKGQLISPDGNKFEEKTCKGDYGVLTLKSSGQWIYIAKNSQKDIQSLGEGDHVYEVFKVKSVIGECHTIKVKINGINDPAIINGVDTGSVTEDTNVTNDGKLVAEGKLTIKDVDRCESAFIAGSQTSNLGTLILKSNGEWTYLGDNSSIGDQSLGAGDSTQDVFTIKSIDGTTHQIIVTINGVGDPAIIGGTDTGSVTEDTNVIGGNLVSDGQLTISDVDIGESAFVPSTQKGILGNLGIDSSGNWEYKAANNQNAVQSLGAGDSVVDSFTIQSVDGTTHQISVTVNGINDPANITGNDSGSVTEDKNVTGGFLIADGKLNVNDVDNGQSVFAASTQTGNLGTLTLDTAGDWEYKADNSQNGVQSLGDGVSTNDLFTIQSIDGTTHQISITLKGTNDPAIIGGNDTGSVTEDTNVVAGNLVTSGQLTINDIDSGESAFIASSKNGKLGTLTLDTSGNWEYQADNSQKGVQSLGLGVSTVDSFTIQSVDGTKHDINVTINGVNDPAVIAGTDTGSVTEDTKVTGGNLVASGNLSITDPDSGEDSFVASTQTGTLGTLTLKTSGSWDYKADNSQTGVQSLGAGASTTETFTVQSVDGTTHQIKITINGVNDPAVIGGVKSGTVTEDTNVVSGQLISSGALTISDPDVGESKFIPTTKSGTYGTLTLDAAGNWQYSATNSQSSIQSLGAADSKQDVFTISSVDGTLQQITLTIKGVNDPAVIGGVSTGSVTEDTNVSKNGKLTASGALTITDVDTGQASFNAGTQNSTLGSLSIDTSGNWLYQATNSQKGIQSLNTGQSVAETFTVSSLDGTTQQIIITINGLNEAPPVVLDLNHDGKIDLISADDSQVNSSILTLSSDSDDFKIGWVGPEEGILVYDKDGLGQVTDFNEISFISYLSGAQSDLEGLVAFDTNQDQQLDAQDDKFSNFGVWQDINSNGIVDPGEYATLIDRGITSISLISDHQSEVIEGNLIEGYTTYQTIDGEEYLAADVALNVQQITDNDPLSLSDIDGEIGLIDLSGIPDLTVSDFAPKISLPPMQLFERIDLLEVTANAIGPEHF